MIVGLHGRLQAGKDTTFAIIRDLTRGEYHVERLSFADPLKDSAAALLGITRDELESMKLDPEPSIRVQTAGQNIALTGREYLQRYGTESHREVFGDDFWVEQAMRKVTRADVIYVITDCRFENEARAIYNRNGVVFEIVGSESVGDAHSSEVRLGDEYIYDTIDNSVRDDGFKNLEQQVLDIIVPVLGGRVGIFA